MDERISALEQQMEEAAKIEAAKKAAEEAVKDKMDRQKQAHEEELKQAKREADKLVTEAQEAAKVRVFFIRPDLKSLKSHALSFHISSEMM